LGDTAAFGFGVTGETPSAPAHVLLAAAITDQEATVNFIDGFLKQSNQEYETREQGGYTLFSDPNGQGLFAVGEDVLFFALSANDIPSLTGDFKSLADNADFTDVMALLPADDYSAVMYMNTPSLVALSQSSMTARTPDAKAMQEMFAPFYDALGPSAVGLTILDGRSLVMDTAQMMGDTAALENAGFDLTMPTTSFDTAFAARVPADAPLAMFGTELNTGVTTGFQNLRAMGKLIQEWAQTVPEDEMDEDARWLRYVNAGNAAVTFANLAFAGMTGLNLENDVLPWMGGNYAAYLRLLPLPEESGAEAMPDFAVVIEATDPAGAPKLLDSLDSAFKQYQLPFSREEVGGSQTLVLSDPLRAFVPPRMQERLQDMPELDILIGGGADVLALGTRPAATYSLDPQGDSLADAPAFTEAKKYALDGAQQFGYLNTRAFVPVIETMISRETGRMAQDMRDARILSGLFSSGSFSTVSKDGSMVARFVLTLAKEPLEPLAVEAEPEPTMIPTVLPTPTFVPSPTPNS
jgi:hypothetical protein